MAKGKRHNRIWPPLDLLNCASVLEKEGFYVKILDANAERTPMDKIIEYSKNFDKIFVSSSSLDRWQCPNININPFLNLTKKMRKGNLFVMGVHGTIRPREILELTNAKAVMNGEPELTVLDICKGKSLSKIRGISYSRNKGIISTKKRGPIDLNRLPLPAYHLLNPKRYYYDLLGKNLAILEASRGCPFSCIFCLKEMYGSKYRKKSAKNLIKEIDYLVKKLDIKNIYFMDLEFTINKGLVDKLCNHLIKERYNLRWCCQTRADSVDMQLLRKMKKAGCALIHYGVETGSPRIMNVINKGIALEKIQNGVRLTKKAGIETACFFMFGFPTETRKDMEKTVKFAKELNPTYASFHVATPYPNTAFYRYNKTDELFSEAYTKEHSAVYLKGMADKAFLSFYLRPNYIIGRLFSANLKSSFNQFKLFLEFVKG